MLNMYTYSVKHPVELACVLTSGNLVQLMCSVRCILPWQAGAGQSYVRSMDVLVGTDLRACSKR